MSSVRSHAARREYELEHFSWQFDLEHGPLPSQPLTQNA
jgi:hypothetical protein